MLSFWLVFVCGLIAASTQSRRIDRAICDRQMAFRSTFTALCPSKLVEGKTVHRRPCLGERVLLSADSPVPGVARFVFYFYGRLLRLLDSLSYIFGMVLPSFSPIFLGARGA